jgi:hypothetical protein
MAYALAVVAVAAIGFIGQAFSQESQPASGRGARDPAARQQRAEQFRQQVADRMKEAMGVTDDEWKVLSPKIEKVTTLARQSRGGMMGGMFGRGRRGGDRPPEGTDVQQSDVEKKASDLQAVLLNKDSKPEEIKTALTAYREARAKAREELTKAQKELQEIVTVRQEAQLVSMGVLE